MAKIILSIGDGQTYVCQEDTIIKNVGRNAIVISLNYSITVTGDVGAGSYLKTVNGDMTFRGTI